MLGNTDHIVFKKLYKGLENCQESSSHLHLTSPKKTSKRKKKERHIQKKVEEEERDGLISLQDS